MNGLGIYRSYRRLKDEQELLRPLVNGVDEDIELPMDKKDYPKPQKFTPEQRERYMQLRKLIEEEQQKDKKNG